MTAVLAIAAAIFMSWIYLIAARGNFWRAPVFEDGPPAKEPRSWPSVVAIVPARNESDMISKCFATLLDLDYPGSFHVILIDDQSIDATAASARNIAEARRPNLLTVLTGRPLMPGWTGKLWAMQQGLDRITNVPKPPRYLLFTDADIAFAADTLKLLVSRAESSGLVLTSLMAKLRCESFPERALIPAFVFFFRKLYPFEWVNQQRLKIAAAAGGCMLVRLDALAAVGGLASIRGNLIDDCALARLLKPLGPIRLDLTERVQSLRHYARVWDVDRMVSRSAYEQLRRSPLWLAGTLAGMTFLYLVPPGLALCAAGLPQALAAACWITMALAFQPLLRFYGVSPLWGLALPAIACAYMVFTLHSAYQHASGKGGHWKGRAQANVSEVQ
jgi:hopene-associated glycosyltransferase HpnB